MKKAIFDKGMSRLVHQFPEKTFHMEIIWDFTQDLADEQFTQAISAILTSSHEITKATNIIAVIRNKAICKDNKTAGEAWAEVLRQVSKVGSYGIPKFSSPVIQKSVDAIGWRQICLSEMPTIERAHFLKTYEAIAEREKNRMLSETVKLSISDATKKIEYKK